MRWSTRKAASERRRRQSIWQLHKAGKRTLLCDFDPQANATSGLGVDKNEVGISTYDIVIDGKSAAEAVIHTKYGDLLASGAALSGAGVELVGLERREYCLRDALDPKAVRQ